MYIGQRPKLSDYPSAALIPVVQLLTACCHGNCVNFTQETITVLAGLFKESSDSTNDLECSTDDYHTSVLTNIMLDDQMLHWILSNDVLFDSARSHVSHTVCIFMC